MKKNLEEILSRIDGWNFIPSEKSGDYPKMERDDGMEMLVIDFDLVDQDSKYCVYQLDSGTPEGSITFSSNDLLQVIDYTVGEEGALTLSTNCCEHGCYNCAHPGPEEFA